MSLDGLLCYSIMVETTHKEFISNLARTLFTIIIYYYHNKTPIFYFI